MKQKLRPLLLPVLFLLLGLILGSGVTKLTTGKDAKSDNNSNETTPSDQTASNSNETTPGAEVQSETYTVQPGDTLFGISIKLNVSMDELSQLNGITDANQIKVGQILKIPGTGASSEETKLVIDQTKMQELQALVDKGEQSWRLDPVEVVKATSPASYEFSAVDTYTLKSKDETSGTAIVTVKKSQNSKTYQVTLVQPVKKGSQGIWTISTIKEIL